MAGAGVLADDEDAVGVSEVLDASPSPCRCRSSRSARGRSIRGTCSSNRAGCWCRTAGRRARRETRPRCWRGRRCRTTPRRARRARSVRRRSARRHRPTRSARNGRTPARRTIGCVRRPCLSSHMSLCASSSAIECCAKNSGVTRARRRLRGHGLGAVLAKLGRLSLAVRIRPGAARAVEAVLLVEIQQRLEAALDPHFAGASTHRLPDRREARCRQVSPPGLGRLLFGRRLGAGRTLGEMRVSDLRFGVPLVGRAVLVLRIVRHADRLFVKVTCPDRSKTPPPKKPEPRPENITIFFEGIPI